MTKTVVVTGAMGFIGSHTSKIFKEAGWRVIGVDRYATIPQASRYMDQLFHDDFAQIAATAVVTNQADTVIHCAGTSLVGPSMFDPGEYYHNNCAKTNTMLDDLALRHWNNTVVFSSSAATYGAPTHNRSLMETDALDPISPYGWSKLFCERIIKDHCRAHNIKGVALRYFNACGADPDKTLGHVEDDTHLIPRILSAYQNKKPFTLYGNNYNTPDGTCIRDYLHVADIARAHLHAAELGLVTLAAGEFRAYNLGTNQGHSNLEVIQASEKAVNDKIEYIILDRRSGDPDRLIANSDCFQRDTRWQPYYSDIETIVRTSWDWQQRYSK